MHHSPFGLIEKDSSVAISNNDIAVMSRPNKRQARVDSGQEDNGVIFLDGIDFDDELSQEEGDNGDVVGDPTIISDMSSEWEDDIALFGDDFSCQQINDSNPAEVDSFLAKELAELSMEDREKIYYDVHGVSPEIDETPELMEIATTQMKEELLLLKDHAEVYQQALKMNTDYVHDEKMLLKFLRADRFDGKLAARRLTMFFKMKLDLFGPDLLVKDIAQDDLSEEDLNTLYNSVSFDLPFRDRAGRHIGFMLPQLVTLPIRSLIRKYFYMVMVMVEDEETQKKGLVFISYMCGQQLNWQHIGQRNELNRQYGILLRCIPVRLEATHLCTDSLIWRAIFSIYKFGVSPSARMRTREHIGNHQEIRLSLQTFGIPMLGFPILENGEVQHHLNKERWEKRRKLEHLRKQPVLMEQQQAVAPAATCTVTAESNQKRSPPSANASNREHIQTPSLDDVLLGRGKPYYTHVGNIRLRNIVLEKSDDYDSAGFSGKKKVGDAVIKLIESRGGRFLKDDGAGWITVDDSTAQKKVSHAFRTLRRFKKPRDSKPGEGGSSVKRRMDSLEGGRHHVGS